MVCLFIYLCLITRVYCYCKYYTHYYVSITVRIFCNYNVTQTKFLISRTDSAIFTEFIKKFNIYLFYQLMIWSVKLCFICFLYHIIFLLPIIYIVEMDFFKQEYFNTKKKKTKKNVLLIYPSKIQFLCLTHRVPFLYRKKINFTDWI